MLRFLELCRVRGRVYGAVVFQIGKTVTKDFGGTNLVRVVRGIITGAVGGQIETDLGLVDISWRGL